MNFNLIKHDLFDLVKLKMIRKFICQFNVHVVLPTCLSFYTERNK